MPASSCLPHQHGSADHFCLTFDQFSYIYNRRLFWLQTFGLFDPAADQRLAEYGEPARKTRDDDKVSLLILFLLNSTWYVCWAAEHHFHADGTGGR